MELILGIVLVVLAYLLGSLATAVLVCRIMKLPDPRKEGSGNPGATNVLRLGGKQAAALTLVGDMLKGAFPVVIAHLVTDHPTILAATAVAAFVGHLYPVFFAFKGGKGVATAFGAVAALVLPVALFMAAVWVLVVIVTRYVSLASMGAAVLAPLFALLFIREPAFILALVVIAALVVYRHRANIERLRQGAEPEIDL